MRRVIFETEIFKTKKDLERGESALRIYLDALFRINQIYLRDYPAFPRLYQTPVRYRSETPGAERWKSVPIVFKERQGDCEDLACWRAAELVVRDNIAAFPKFVSQPVSRPGFRLYHIVVQLPNGTTEDPSKRLGMKGNA